MNERERAGADTAAIAASAGKNTERGHYHQTRGPHNTCAVRVVRWVHPTFAVQVAAAQDIRQLRRIRRPRKMTACWNC